MRVAVSGGTGLIGSAIGARLREEGHEVLVLTRGARARDSGGTAIPWDPARGELEPGRLEGLDAVVHLAGESIAARWTAAKKERIRSSREKTTRLLVDTLGRVRSRPKVFVSASGVNYYGDCGEAEVDETTPRGHGFLSEVCRIWEAETSRARELGIRPVSLRLGAVLSTRGGALGAMLLPFKLGLGGPVGSGKQWMSWVHLADVVEAFRFAMEKDGVEGALNVTAPQPVRNADFAKALGKALGRPALLPLPGFAVKLLFGEMGEELLLGGQKVLPRRLDQAGFRFQHPELLPALRDLLAAGG